MRFWECTLGGTGELGCEVLHIRYLETRLLEDGADTAVNSYMRH